MYKYEMSNDAFKIATEIILNYYPYFIGFVFVLGFIWFGILAV